MIVSRLANLVAALLATLAAVTLLAIVAIVALTGTERGTRWLLETGAGLAGDRLAIDAAGGTLLDGLDVARLRLRTAGVDAELSAAVIRLHWPDLFRRQVTLKSPAADALVVVLTPDPDAARGDGGAIELPVAIAIDDLQLGSLRVHTGAGDAVVIDDLRFSGRFDDGVIDFDELAATLYGARVDVAGRFDTARPYALSARTGWRLPALDLRGTGQVSGSLAALEFEQRMQPAAGGEAEIAGTLGILDRPPTLAATARWEHLALDVPGAGLVTSDGGRARLQGDLDDFRAEVAAELRLPVGEQPAVSLQGLARGDIRALDLERLNLRMLNGEIDGKGVLDMADGFAGRFRLEGRNLDPAVIDSRFQGSIGFAGDLSFNADGSFEAVLQRAEGHIAGRPLSASGSVARRDDVLQVDGLSIAAGANRVSLEGMVAPRADLRFRLAAPELHVLWPGLDGAVDGEGTLAGTVLRPAGNVRFAGATISYDRTRVERLQLDASLDEGGRLDVDFAAGGVTAGDTVIGDVTLLADGRVDDFRTHLELRGGLVEALLDGSAGWAGSTLRGAFSHTLHQGAVAGPGGFMWRLQSPATIARDGSAWSLGSHCWLSGDAQLCIADSSLTPDRTSAGVMLTAFPLAAVGGFLDDDLDLGGVLDARLEIARDAGRLTGFLIAETSGAAITLRMPEGDQLTDRIETFRLRIDALGDEITYDGQFQDSFGTSLAATGRVTGPLGPEPGIIGTIDGGIPDLGRLSPVVERFVDVGDLAGSLRLEVRLGGRLRAPDLSGGVELSDGALSVPAAGIQVGDIGLAVEGRDDGTATVRGGASSGGGTISLDGDLRWRNALVPEGRFTIGGENFLLVQLPDGTARVTPDLRVLLQDRLFRISGRLLVPHAAITLSEIGEAPVEVSPDVVVHGREAESAPVRTPLFVLDGIDVVLGSDVSFEGFGLTAKLAGNLLLEQDIGVGPDMVRGDGVVRVTSGRFEALGQTLTIERGALIFSGPLDQPAIDVRAVREISYGGRDVTVGLLLTGNVSRIQSQVFSEPAMGEMDALAYLTTGRPLSEAGAGDRLSVTNAALTLGLRGVLPVTERLGAALNVDEFGVAGGDDGASLVVGERFGQDLFLRYSFGIFNRVGVVRVTYQLNRRFSIEGTSGEEQALDLIYSVTW